MFVKQITMFIENRPGRLSEFTALMAEHEIDLLAISVADTTNFGILRSIVKDSPRAAEVLRTNGYTVNLTDVLAVSVPDVPGGLARVMALLHEKEIAIEYLYSLVRRMGHQAVIVVRVDKPQDAAVLFAENGVKLLKQSDIDAD